MTTYLVFQERRGKYGWHKDIPEILDCTEDDLKKIKMQDNEYVQRRFFKITEVKVDGKKKTFDGIDRKI